MRNIFKSYAYTWRQITIFKWTMILWGIIIGAYWYEFFSEYLIILLVVAVIASFYISYISFKK